MRHDFANVDLSLPENAQSVFLAWEKLRLAYNAVLIGVVLLFLANLQPQFGDAEFWLYVVAGAVGANVCFCAGPIAEGYLCWFGADRLFARHLVFLLGTAMAVLLTALHLFSFAIPQWP